MRFSLRKKDKNKSRQPRVGADADGYVFRRSRTLTGTTSDKVNVTTPKRSQLKTIRLQAHELHQLRMRVLRVLGVVVLVIALLGFVVANYIGTVALQYVQPGGAPRTQDYEQSVVSYFRDRPLQRFGFSINQKEFSAYIQAEHPEIATVDIDRDWYGGNAKFVINFRHPVLTWESGGRHFYVDDQGVAFTYDHFGGKYVAVSDQSGITPTAGGGAIASNRLIAFLGQMVGAINVGDKGNVTEIIIPASTREVDVKLEGRGYMIKTHTDRDPLAQAEDIIHAIEWFDDKGASPEYIDVRVSGEAFYK